VATGETHSVKEFVQTAFDAAGIPNWEDYVKQDPKYMRPADVELLKGVPDRTIEKLGWRPEISFDSLVQMMVESDIKALRKEKDYKN